MDDVLEQEEQTRHHNDKELLAFLWPYIKPHLAVIIVTLLATLGSAISSVLQPYIFKIIIDEHIKVMNFSGLGTLLIIYLVLLGAYFAFSWTQCILATYLDRRLLGSFVWI